MNPLGDARKCLEKNSKSKDTNAQMVKNVKPLVDILSNQDS